MSSEPSTEESDSRLSRATSMLVLGALGIVFGDIGTSPLYAMRECFFGEHGIAATESNILGVLSLIFWSLVIVISLKYLLLVMRADNNGEGGELALTAFCLGNRVGGKGTRGPSRIILAMGLFGAALLYGDGVITPAISVLSAVEGLKIATPVFEPYVIPITLVILTVLFFFQRHGTSKIGRVFGPIMLIWFSVLFTLGAWWVVANPEVLRAISPLYAIRFLGEEGLHGFVVLGSVFLVVTGGEALYADMGHFGKAPIRIGWFCVALPALAMNYFGQGALLLSSEAAAKNPFYLMAPSWALLPLVVVATCATVIASQAVISGTFSLTRQAVQLGYLPRMEISHTSTREIGQIYVPFMNWTLLIITLWLVVEFHTSSNLAAAYGIAVSTTMVITTLLIAAAARKRWGWSWFWIVLVIAPLLVIDIGFWTANSLKIADGGWFPLVFGVAVFTLMTTWFRGREILAERLYQTSTSLEDFVRALEKETGVVIPGTAVFMFRDTHGTPPALIHNMKHNRILHERVIVLSVVTEETPFVPMSQRVVVDRLSNRFTRVVAHYGFMQTPSIRSIFKACRAEGLEVDPLQATYFLGRETLIATERPGMALWRERLFAFMSRNAQRAAVFFELPSEQVIEIGLRVEL